MEPNASRNVRVKEIPENFFEKILRRARRLTLTVPDDRCDKLIPGNGEPDRKACL